MRLLISTGPTIEPIDPVRYLTNHSSGSMGLQIALAAAIDGHIVTLLHSKACISPTAHPRINTVPFTTTRDLQAKLQESWPSHDVLIMVAAVADFTVRGGQYEEKMSRTEPLQPVFVPTEDLVAQAVQQKRDDQQVIAFALADDSILEDSARLKMSQKGVDVIVANPMQTMNSKELSGTAYCVNGQVLSPTETLSKPAFATWLIDQFPSLLATT